MKTLAFTIQQENFNYSFILDGGKKELENEGEKLAKSICQQIKGRMYALLLIKAKTKQKIFSLNKSFSFGFSVGNIEVNTASLQESLGLNIKLGKSADKRKNFENLLEVVIAEVLRGSKLYTKAEIERVEKELNTYSKK